MSTMTSPRNASSETRRVLGSVLVSETVETATTGFSSCADSTMAAIQSAKLAIDQVVANPELKGAFQCPRVKSGNFCGAPCAATDASLNGVGALQAAAS